MLRKGDLKLGKITIERSGYMARKRMIDPEFWSDQEIGFWSPLARLFYIALWNFADDEGRLKAHSKLLKAQVFPYETKVDIDSLKMEVAGKVHWYKVKDQEYGYIRNFFKHQTINKPTPSKLPSPNDSFECYGTTTVAIPEESSLREEKRIEEKRSESYVDFEKSTHATWNSFCERFPMLPRVREISAKRRTKLKLRWQVKSFREFQVICDAIALQPFLTGRNKYNWRVSFDWLIDNDTNYLKVLEFKYTDDNVQGDPILAAALDAAAKSKEKVAV
jgi:hypothetical protein